MRRVRRRGAHGQVLSQEPEGYQYSSDSERLQDVEELDGKTTRQVEREPSHVCRHPSLFLCHKIGNGGGLVLVNVSEKTWPQIPRGILEDTERNPVSFAGNCYHLGDPLSEPIKRIVHAGIHTGHTINLERAGLRVDKQICESLLDRPVQWSTLPSGVANEMFLTVPLLKLHDSCRVPYWFFYSRAMRYRCVRFTNNYCTSSDLINW